jgi:hypothetical protein
VALFGICAQNDILLLGKIAAPLVNRSLRLCPALPLSPWTVVAWWAVAASSALIQRLLPA